MKFSRYFNFMTLSLVYTAINLVNTLINIPLQLHYLRVDVYGNWVLLSSIGLLASVIGVGVPQAVLKYFSVERNSFRPLFLRVVLITLIQTLVLAVILVIGRPIIFNLVGLAKVRNEIDSPYTVLCINWVVSVPLNVMISFMFALNRHNKMYAIQTISSVTVVVMTWVVLRTNKGIYGLSVVQLLITGMTLVTCGFLIQGDVKRWMSPLRVDKDTDIVSTKELLSFSMYQFLSQVSYNVIFNLDNILAARYAGIQEMVFYNFRLRIFQALVSVTLKPFWNYIPTISRLVASSDFTSLRRLILRATRISMGAIGVVSVFYFMDVEKIIQVWTGKAIPYNWSLDACFGAMLLIDQYLGNLAVVLAGSDAAVLRKSTYISLTEAGVNLVLSIVLARRFGTFGIALGTLLPRVLITCLMLSKIQISYVRIPIRQLVVHIVYPWVFSLVIIAPLWITRSWWAKLGDVEYLASLSLIGGALLVFFITLALGMRLKSYAKRAT